MHRAVTTRSAWPACSCSRVQLGRSSQLQQPTNSFTHRQITTTANKHFETDTETALFEKWLDGKPASGTSSRPTRTRGAGRAGKVRGNSSAPSEFASLVKKVVLRGILPNKKAPHGARRRERTRPKPAGTSRPTTFTEDEAARYLGGQLTNKFPAHVQRTILTQGIEKCRSRMPPEWTDLNEKQLEEAIKRAEASLQARHDKNPATVGKQAEFSRFQLISRALEMHERRRSGMQKGIEQYRTRLRSIGKGSTAQADNSPQKSSKPEVSDDASRPERPRGPRYAERRRANKMARRPGKTAGGADSKAPPLSSFSHVISPESAKFQSLHTSEVPVAKLAHNLDRVLFNPGVHFLRDPRSGVYNFPRFLEAVPPLDDFAFDKLPQYVTSSKDEFLKTLTRREKKTFAGSTSSVVAMLCQIYMWMSKGKRLNFDMLSAPWQEMDSDFSMGQQLPASVVLHYDGGSYAIDADKSMDVTLDTNVLAEYGHMMEKLVTTEEREFGRFLKSSADPAPSEANEKQAYQYSETEHMVLRSQLDAHDEHLPNVTFDVKTRGTVAIRQDRLNYVENAGYTIDKLHGPWESFEREYYDLIRSAFLKYQFQARIGRMDGCFVAYHSTKRFFGFQYVPISDMDIALFGSTEAGDQVFKLALQVLESVLLEAKSCYPEQSIRLTFAADARGFAPLRVFVHPLSDKEPDAVGDGARMTLFELRSANYLDGKPVRQVSIVRPENADVDWKAPVWTIGYDIAKSSVEHEAVVSDAEASQKDVTAQQPEDASSAVIEEELRESQDDATVIAETSQTAEPKQTETKQDATEDSATTILQPRQKWQPASPARILKLFKETRAFQSMFSVLTLPSGVSRESVMAAAERLSKLVEDHRTDGAIDGAEGEDEVLEAVDAGGEAAVSADEETLSARAAAESELDPDDLALRFPVREGLDYKKKPSLVVKGLRARAKEGHRRLLERQARETEGAYTEVESVVRERSGRDGETA